MQKSLVYQDVDFRPPSSAKADPKFPVGPYYRWMLREVSPICDTQSIIFHTTNSC